MAETQETDSPMDEHFESASALGRNYFTRSKLLTEHKAAGVLPLCVHSSPVLVLLGAEDCRTGPSGCVTKTMWRDFGGGREAIDVDVEATASREFAEETLGLFASTSVDASGVALSHALMAAQLRDRRNALQVIHHLKKGQYAMFIAHLPYVDPLFFHLATQQNQETHAVQGAEKTAFAWVRLDELLAVTRRSAATYHLRCWARCSGGNAGGRRPVTRGRRCLQLHPCFASSLRIARREGLRELIAAARTEAGQEQVSAAPLLHPRETRAHAQAEERQPDVEHAAEASAAAGPCSSAGRVCSEVTAEEACCRLGGDGGAAQGEAKAAHGGSAHTGAGKVALTGTSAAEHGDDTSEREIQPVLPSMRIADVSSSQACIVQPQPLPEHPPAFSTREMAMFDMSPEWQRALQSLAAVPGLSVFAKRLTCCNAQ